MTLAELKLDDLTHIKSRYYYLPGDEAYNIFYVSMNDLEPTSLKEMLVDLSTKVSFGNNYVGVAACLNLPRYMQRNALELDRMMMEGFC